MFRNFLAIFRYVRMAESGRNMYIQCSKWANICWYMPELLIVPEFHTGTYQYGAEVVQSL
jgi:hypothetical protein